MKTIQTMKTTLLITCLMITGAVHAQSWLQQTSNTTEDLLHINFYNSSTGMVFGDTLSTMVKTSNQGVLWSGLNPVFTAGELLSSSYLDANTIVAVGVHDIAGGDGLVMRSTNGGSTWTADTNIPTKLFDVSFANATSGWISGEDGYIARTTNGGTSWQQQSTGTGEDIFSIDFVDANEGWAVGTVDSIAVIMHTTNAGANWTMQISGVTEPLFSVFFVDDMNGWAVGANGTIIATADGGTAWIPKTSGVLNDLIDVSFVSASNGWAVGGGGTILMTTDGGNTWTPQASAATGDINSIDMLTVNSGWLCGKNGQIQYYGFPSVISEYSSTIELNVHPNPATDRINVVLEDHKGKWSVRLYDITGRLQLQGFSIKDNIITVERNDLQSGIYFIEAASKGFVQTRKIIFE